MNSERAIEILNRQREQQAKIPNQGSSGEDFLKWRRDTAVAIRKIFGEDSRHSKEFSNIDFSPMAYPTTPAERQDAYNRGMARTRTLLLSLVDEIKEYGTEAEVLAEPASALQLLEQICKRFHSAARQLNARHDDRPTLSIVDEYDVQDLMHALLRIHFEDIREEEWTPSFAGASSRQDFLLKNERIVVEIKKTRPTLKAKQLGEELIVDIARYGSHPDCDCLVCFVYDPEARIANPIGLERDLEALASDKT